MQTRMEKYYEEEKLNLRENKNRNLYRNISEVEVEDYELESNATVIDSDARNIDVEQIKKILDNKYNKEPKRRSIIVEEKEEDPIISLDETREYDINAILERARSEKEDNYESERFKKLRDTQYDILSGLDLDSPEEKEEVENKELMTLINTITAREMSNDIKKAVNEISKPKEEEEINPLDILTDLKGSDDTLIVGGISADSDSINETNPVMSLAEAEKIKPQVETRDLSNTLTFTQSDFDDFNDLKKEVNSHKALIYFVIGLVVVLVLVALVFFLNKFLNLSLF